MHPHWHLLPIRHLQATSPQAPAFDRIPTLTSCVLSPQHERPRRPRCQVLHAGQDPGARSPLCDVRPTQERGDELGTRRNSAPSWRPRRARTRSSRSARRCLRRSSPILRWAMTVSRHSTAVSETRRLWDTGWCAVSPLFTDVVQCLGTPLLEIKKSESCDWYWHVCMR